MFIFPLLGHNNVNLARNELMTYGIRIISQIDMEVFIIEPPSNFDVRTLQRSTPDPPCYLSEKTRMIISAIKANETSNRRNDYNSNYMV